MGYTQADPLGLAAGWNRFSYVEGNPFGFADPDGLQVAIPAPLAGACVGSAGAGCAAAAAGLVGLTSYELTDQYVNPWLQPKLTEFVEWCSSLLENNEEEGCNPPEGTIFYIIDRVPPSRPHFPIEGSHYHLWKMNRNPITRQCHWNKMGASRMAPPGAMACPFERPKR